MPKQKNTLTTKLTNPLYNLKKIQKTDSFNTKETLLLSLKKTHKTFLKIYENVFIL